MGSLLKALAPYALGAIGIGLAGKATGEKLGEKAGELLPYVAAGAAVYIYLKVKK